MNIRSKLDQNSGFLLNSRFLSLGSIICEPLSPNLSIFGYIANFFICLCLSFWLRSMRKWFGVSLGRSLVLHKKLLLKHWLRLFCTICWYGDDIVRVAVFIKSCILNTLEEFLDCWAVFKLLFLNREKITLRSSIYIPNKKELMTQKILHIFDPAL